MKNRLVYGYVGKILQSFSITLLLPIIVGLIYHESVLVYIAACLLSLFLGALLRRLPREDDDLYAKDGFIIVSLSWIIISIISGIPFMVVAKLDFFSAFFEAVSGLTTTGATVFSNVEVLTKSLLFWRSFTHFLGGMGILAFVMAVIPLSKKDKSMYLLKAEMPGPDVAKLVPSLKKTLFYLYAIYLGLTISEIILLIIAKMPLYDSILIAFGTAGTGGFSILNTSLASYTVMAKIVVALFMLLFGVNFNVYFLILMKNVKSALKSEELKVYLAIYTLSVIIIVLSTYKYFANFGEALLEGAFHISSFITSTGYSIGDVNIYPTNARILVLLLMLISACAGSTCGGFKMSRLIISVKKIKRDLIRLIHPNMVKDIKFEGKSLDESVVQNTTTFMLLYVVLIIIIMFIVSFDPLKLSLSQVINATFTTFANVGLCFDITNFGAFSALSKLVLSIGMLLGRLEIFPLIVLFTNIHK